MAKNKSSRKVVGSPLTPASICAMGAFREFPPTPAEFDPAGEWVNAYRIWTCGGYSNGGNEDSGCLVLHRKLEEGGGGRLIVDQTILNDSGVVHETHAEIACGDETLTGPFQWRLTSRFVALNGDPMPSLDRDEAGRIDGDALQMTTGGKTFRRPGSKRLVAGWRLFEALQRHPLTPDAEEEFDVLEDLSLLRPGYRLAYRGASPANLNGAETSLHGFSLIGHGLLPYEFWLNDRRRLVMAVMGPRAYILDDQAKETIAERLEQKRRYVKSKTGGSEGGNDE